MAYKYAYTIIIQERWGLMGTFFKAFKYIKLEDSDKLTKMRKHDKRTSLNKV